MKEEIVAIKISKEEQIKEFMDEHASKRLTKKDNWLVYIFWYEMYRWYIILFDMLSFLQCLLFNDWSNSVILLNHPLFRNIFNIIILRIVFFNLTFAIVQLSIETSIWSFSFHINNRSHPDLTIILTHHVLIWIFLNSGIVWEVMRSDSHISINIVYIVVDSMWTSKSNWFLRFTISVITRPVFLVSTWWSYLIIIWTMFRTMVILVIWIIIVLLRTIHIIWM